jgi:response regulator RpfG family c-di-GMP phosphodiesterase
MLANNGYVGRHPEDMTMHQQIMIVDDFTERTMLMAQALRDSGYRVLTLQVHTNEELQENLSRLQPDFLVIGDEVVIDLNAKDCVYHDIKMAS